MQLEQLVLPTLATIALGAALLVPLRDDRRGKRATLGGVQPMRTEFYAVDTDRTRSDAVTEEANSALENASTPSPTTTPSTFADESVSHPEAPVRVSTAVERSHIENEISASNAATSLDALAAPMNDLFMKQPLKDRLKSLVALLGFSPKSARENDASLTLPCIELTRSFVSELDTLLNLNRPESERVTPIRAISTQALHRMPIPPTIVSLEPPGTLEAIKTEPTSHDVSIVPAQRTPMDRVVPLTRLPLRPHHTSITWTQSIAGIAAFARDAELAGRDRHLRHALLFSLTESACEDAVAALHVAFREEDAEGRCLVLRAMMRHSPSAGARAIYIDALRSGTDDERSIAIDGLVRIGERAAVVPAFNDRLDAIAAKAALSYVDSRDRMAYIEALEPHVDRARIDAILALLAGFVE